MTASDTTHRAGRGAVAVAILASLVAIPVLIYEGREQWFFLDEWDFLTDRSLTSISDLMRPHNQHWSAIPIVIYRVLFRLVGIRHYWPYQLTLILCHVVVAWLLFMVMRRARVNQWIATAATAAFLFLGSGEENIEWAFQIGFTGAVAFGLGFLLLVDHDGPLVRRDVVGLACGLGALLCSGVGVAMVAAVGVAVLARRGWRMALVVTVPLGLVFLGWYTRWGHEGGLNAAPSFSGAVRFVWSAITNVFDRLGQLPGVGVALAAVLVAGVVLVVRREPQAVLRQRYAATVGLALGALLFAGETAYGRAGSSVLDQPGASRYVYVICALLLPAVAVAATQVGERVRPLMPVMILLLLVGIPGNIRAFHQTGFARLTLGDPAVIQALAQSPQLARAPSGLQPLPFEAGFLTAGWLRRAKASGKLPAAAFVSQAARQNAGLALSLAQQPSSLPPGRSCRQLKRDEVFTLGRNQEIVIPTGGFITVDRLVDGRPAGSTSYLATAVAPFGNRVRNVADPLVVQLRLPRPRDVAEVCP